MAQAKDMRTVEQKLADGNREVRADGEVIGTKWYRPTEGVALPNAGAIALDNWTGRVGNFRVRVYRGAPAKDIPAEVVKAMAASGCKTGKVTWADIGIRPIADTDRRDPRVVSVEPAPETP